MTLDDFALKMRKNFRLSEEDFNKTYVVLPCNCNLALCEGFALVLNRKELIDTHNAMFNK